MKLFFFRAPVLLLLLALTEPSCRPNETVEDQARDAKIKTAIKTKLASDVGAATLTSVSVNVTNGVVTLSGPVHSEDEKGRVESIARSAEGVVSVNNALQVMAAAPPSSGGMTTSTGSTATTTTTTSGTSTAPLPTATPGS